MSTARSFLVLVGGVVVWAQSETILVQTEQGPVVGRRDPELGIYTFLNIPYATAPTGTNKFKNPLPPLNRTEPYDVADKIIACIQAVPVPFTPDGNLPQGVSMEEDCLVANIRIPDTTETNLPVMVMIHGGAYQSLYGEAFRFGNLVQTKRVIVVSFNYRLGVHGFLCLGTEDIPGNAGMKDQVALLRWVRKNILYFGGNPDDVTISGCSAGGGSVDFLIVSPMATGLFNKAIPDSGAILGSVGPQPDPVHNAKVYAKHLNFTNVNDLSALEEFYKNASYEVLFSDGVFVLNRDDSLALFTPCVERDTGTGEERFIDDAPWNYLKNDAYHKVPLLTGFAEMEGLISFLAFPFESNKHRMNEKFADFLPAELQFENEAKKDAVAATVKAFYFGDEPVSEETILSYVDYYTDIMFAYPMVRVINKKALKGDSIYLLKYLFVDENSPVVPYTNVKGADHCAQVLAVADDEVTFAPNHTEAYQEIRENLRNMWLNFITTGNPTPEGTLLPSWAPVRSNASPFMSVNQTIELQESSLLETRVRFWDSIYDQYYKLPISPAEHEWNSNHGTLAKASFLLIITMNLVL